MGVLQVIDVNENRVIDEISFYEGKISYANGLAQNLFETTRDGRQLSDEEAFHQLNGWSNGYMRVAGKPGTHPEEETTQTASLTIAQRQLVAKMGRLEAQAQKAVDSDRRRRFNEVRKQDALWFMRETGGGRGAISAQGSDA